MELFLPALKDAAHYFHEQDLPFKMKAVPAGTGKFLQQALPGHYQFIPDRKSWDYLYLTKDLLELKGRKYQQKRNHINKFKQLYDYSYESIETKHIKECLDTFEYWVADKGEDLTIQEERLALQEALNNLKSLGLQGGLLRVNGRVAAFSLGSLLNAQTAHIHFEKANQELSGIYSVINQHFVEQAWSETKYINREDDLGIPGLREAKRRYHPTRMIRKFIIREEPGEKNDD